MKNLRRLQLRKYSAVEIEQEVDQVLHWVLSVCNPLKIILLGSALGNQFDDCSDIDLVLIFKSKEDAREARKRLYTSMRPVQRPVECLCVDAEKFNEMSNVGGIYWVAKKEGKVLFSDSDT